MAAAPAVSAADRGYARLHGARALRQAACPVAVAGRLAGRHPGLFRDLCEGLRAGQRAARQEEQRGLYAETATIGTRTGWQARLAAAGLTLRGYRVVHNR